ncbi:MAG: hypothetical protein FWD78_12770 [Treponema sp.]|nr:hypothetical protein [Treponema sp.]
MKKYWIAAVFAVLFTAGIWGQTTYTWTGAAGDTSWNTNGNWAGGTSPLASLTSSDTLIINCGVSGSSAVLNRPASLNLDTLQMDSGSFNLGAGPNNIANLVVNGGTLTLNAGLNNITSLVVNGGTLVLSTAITVTNFTVGGAASITGSAANTITTTNITAETAAAVLTATPANMMIIGGGTFTISGTAITITGNITATGTVNGGIKNVDITASSNGGTLNIGNITTTTGSKTLNLNGNKTLNAGSAVFTDVNVGAGITVTMGSPLYTDNLLNPGTLDLVNYNFTVTTNLNNTNGTIRLNGEAAQTVNIPAGFAASGTIGYYGSQPAYWRFGNVYYNLRIDNSLMADNPGTLTVNGYAIIGLNVLQTSGNQTYSGPVTLIADTVNFAANAASQITFGSTVSGQTTPRNLQITNANVEFDGAVTANIASVTATAGRASIYADITTSGNQSYVGVLLGGTGVRTLTSNSGSISISGAVVEVTPGTGANFKACSGILLNNIGNALGGNVSLNNNMGAVGSQSGEISFVTQSSVTVSGANSAAGGTGQDGFFTVDTSINNQNINVAGITDCYQLILKTGTGSVTIGGAVSVRNSSGIEGEGIAAVYVSAATITGSGSINLQPGVSEVCVNIDSTPSYTGTVTGTPPRIHYHSRTGHIIYRAGPDNGSHGIAPPYLYFDSDNVRGYSFTPASGKNIYIIDCGNLGPSAANTFTANGSGSFIEFRGAYQANDVKIKQVPGGIVRLAKSDINPSNPASVTLNNSAFILPQGSFLELANGTSSDAGPSSITAAGITLGNITSSGNTGVNNLRLDSGNFGINVNGDIGAGTNGVASDRIGAISVYNTGTAAASFDGIIYVQSFAFNGVNLALLQDTVLYSALTVTVNNSGTCVLSQAKVITSNNDIHFYGVLRIDGYAILDTGTGAGNIEFSETAPQAIIGTTHLADSLTLAAGAGDIYINKQIGTDGTGGTALLYLGDIVINNMQNTLIPRADFPGANNIYAGSFRQSGTGNISLNGKIAAGNISPVNAVISFANDLYLLGSSTLSAPATGGLIVLRNVIQTTSTELIFGGGQQGSPLEISQTGSSPIGSVSIIQDSYAAVAPGNIIRQKASSTLLLYPGSAGSVTALDTASGTWQMGDSGAMPPAGFTAFTGFAGYDGTFSFQQNTKLVTKDFYTADSGNHEITIYNDNIVISASGSVSINRTFTPASSINNTTLVMTGGTGPADAPELRVSNDSSPTKYPYDPPVLMPTDPPEPRRWLYLPLVSIGNLVIDGTIKAKSNLYIRGNLTINDGKTFIGDSAQPLGPPAPGDPPDEIAPCIFMFPVSQIPWGGGAAPKPAANIWSQIGDGKFDFNDTWVEFGNCMDAVAADYANHAYIIRGDTEWYGLVCHEDGAELRFSNYSAPGIKGHTVSHRFELYPNHMFGPGNADLPENYITITRETFVPDSVLNIFPPYEYYWMPPDNPTNFYWYFTLLSSGRLDMNHTIINYSYSSVKMPVPVAGSLPQWNVKAWPYVQIDDGIIDEMGNLYPSGVTPPGQKKVMIDGVWTNNYYYESDPRNCYNVDWFVFNSFFYAFAEDTNHNGRIDRIRLQSPFNLNGNFSDFEVQVTNQDTGEKYDIDRSQGYLGYRRVQEQPGATVNEDYDLDSIFVYLVEKPYADAGTNLHWSIERNTSLKDSGGKTIVGNPRGQNMDEGIATNTVSPRVTYALALPGYDQIYVQYSGPVVFDQTAVSIYNIAGLTVTSVEQLTAPNEFILHLSRPLGQSEMALLADGSASFTINGLRDKSGPAMDLKTPDEERPFFFMYPSPKYPQNYNYDNDGSGNYQPYVTVHNPLQSIPSPIDPAVYRTVFISTGIYSGFLTGVYPPNMPYDAGNNFLPVDMTEHRFTDMLVSVPPGPNHPDSYFIWPVWAMYDNVIGQPHTDDFYGSTPDNPNIIWEFNSTKFLEALDMTMQVRRGSSLAAFTPSLVFAYDVPSLYRGTDITARGYGSGNRGLWLPKDLSSLIAQTPPLAEPDPYFTNMAPYFYPWVPGVSVFSKVPDSAAPSNLFQYNFNAGSDGYTSGRKMEFYFHLDDLVNTPPDLLAGRLDIKPADDIPSNWYRLVRPFGFAVNDVTRQRSGVTILNNVINPANGESTYVDYTITRGGQVTIQAFTLEGTLVNVMYRGRREPGEYRAVWNGTNQAGRAVARGMYFIRIVGPDIDEIRQVMVVR